jgi:putative N6-adenine-specific DNA methylase
MPESVKTDIAENRIFQRHIRRHVIAPEHRFAVVVPPELSLLSAEELRALGMSGLEITEVGVELSGKLSACYLANLQLRTAGRVLCMLPSFRAGAVEELFKKVNLIQWELWLNPDIPLRLKAFVEYSRIEHEGLAASTVLDGIQKRFRMCHLSAPGESGLGSAEEEGNQGAYVPEQRIFVHLSNNRTVISLDTTGDHLHQRGYRLQHTGAPLRETLAAAILIKSGWKGDTPLIDGMCGSGTLPIEAALIARRLPPGLNRSFLFQQLPSYQEKTWAFLRRKAVEDSLDSSPAPILAIDNSGPAIAIARENAERAGVERNIQWLCEDLFEFYPEGRFHSPGLVFVNPPYGRRLQGGDKAFYERLGAHLRKSFAGWQAVVLAPERSLAMNLHLKSMRFWNIVHGGIPIVVTIAKV